MHNTILTYTAFFSIFFLFLTSSSNSQPLTSSKKSAIKNYMEARSLMKERSFDKAFDKLQLAIKKDANFAEAYLNLAIIYKIRKEDSLQINCYKEVTNRYPKTSRFSFAWFYLGKFSFNSGEYKKTLEYLNQYLETSPNRGKFEKEANQMITNSQFSIEYKVNNFQFKPQPLPSIINQFNQQYFPALTADQKTLIYIKREENEDIMVSKIDKKGNWGRPASISENINTTSNEGTCAISADGRNLVFTACNRPNGYGSCDLYISKKVGEEWSTPQNMGKNINSTAWDSQPSLSADARTLYFVSNRSGGFGQRDIYVSILDNNDNWTKPANLGATINTSFDDISPFIHPSGSRLYFSTDGRPGFGGFDIYFSEKNDKNWSRPVNFGYPINTHNDEVSMFISPDGKEGYYSHEERINNSFTSLLYKINIPKKLKIEHRSSYVYGTVTNKKTRVPLLAKISLIDLENNIPVEVVESDPLNGKYLIVLTEGKEYGLFVEVSNYLHESYNFNLTKTLLDPIEVNFALEPIAIGSKIILNNIFFKFDSFELTNTSKIELSKIIELIQSNSSLKVEISGYTDKSGSKQYNLNLSLKRAKAVYDYLVNNGVNKIRLSYTGFGASNFISDNILEESKRKNRRIEFKIIK